MQKIFNRIGQAIADFFGPEKTPYGALAAIAAFCVFFLFRPLVNPDLYWHLSAGKYILAHHTLPHADFLSWTQQGRPWVDFEWLTQVIYYTLYRMGGYTALYLIAPAFMAGVLFVLYRLLKLYGRHALFVVLAPLWMLASYSSLAIRADNATLLFFAVLYYVLERMRLDRWNLNLCKTGLAALALSALWVNMHAGVFYGILTAGLYFIGEAVSSLRRYVPKLSFSPLRLKLYFVTGLGITLGLLINPYGYKVFGVALAHSADMAKISAWIVEWMPADITSVYQSAYWVLLTGVALLALHRLIRKGDLPLSPLFCVLCFLSLSAQHFRHQIFFSFSATVLLGLLCSRYMADSDRSAKVTGTALTLLFACAMCITRPLSQFLFRPISPYSIKDKTIAYLRQNARVLGPLNMFNQWHWGGYLGWRLYPDYHVFVDGRYIFHGYIPCCQANSWTTLRNEGWLDKYRFGQLLLMRAYSDYRWIKYKLPDGKTVMAARSLYADMAEENTYRVVYWDNEMVIAVRRDAVDKKWLSQRQFTYLLPDNMEYLYFAVKNGILPRDAVMKEIDKYGRLTAALGTYDMEQAEVSRLKNYLLAITPRRK